MKTALDPGVYARGGDGKQRLVYLYQGGAITGSPI